MSEKMKKIRRFIFLFGTCLLIAFFTFTIPALKADHHVSYNEDDGEWCPEDGNTCIVITPEDE